jgi:hypothetical protein
MRWLTERRAELTARLTGRMAREASARIESLPPERPRDEPEFEPRWLFDERLEPEPLLWLLVLRELLPEPLRLWPLLRERDVESESPREDEEFVLGISISSQLGRVCEKLSHA